MSTPKYKIFTTIVKWLMMYIHNGAILMFKHTTQYNTKPCPLCLGAQVKRKLGMLTEPCQQCHGTGRTSKPKAEAKGMYKKKIETVPIMTNAETADIIERIDIDRTYVPMDGEYAASEDTTHSKTKSKAKAKTNGHVKSWSRKKKSA